MLSFQYRDIWKSELYKYAAISNGKHKTEAQAIFLNPFPVCSPCKQQFVVCLFLTKKQKEIIFLQTK
jgi:hypothetical protein